tara:strand:- start:183 stop:383 length:201 start_codon:yes stop_codon:yes gene_type:complete
MRARNSRVLSFGLPPGFLLRFRRRRRFWLELSFFSSGEVVVSGLEVSKDTASEVAGWTRGSEAISA